MKISESWVLSFDKKYSKKLFDLSSIFTNGGLEVEDTLSAELTLKIFSLV